MCHYSKQDVVSVNDIHGLNPTAISGRCVGDIKSCPQA